MVSERQQSGQVDASKGPDASRGYDVQDLLKNAPRSGSSSTRRPLISTRQRHFEAPTDQHWQRHFEGALSIQYPKDPKATDSPCGIEEQAKGTSTEAKVSEFPEDIEVDFCVEGELQQCEHTLTVVQSLSAERGSKNAALDTALRALNELVPAYAAKLQDKRWLLSHAAELENSSEALQLLLLADDEQNLEAAAKSGRDIPELLVAAQALAKILSSGSNGCSSGGCGSGGCGSGGCGSGSGCRQKTDKATSCASGGCGSCKNQGSCKSQSPQVEVNADGVVRLSAVN